MRFNVDAFKGKKVCISICTHGRRDLLLRALDSLRTLYVEEHYNVTILIVENEKEAILRDELLALNFPFPLHYVHEPNLGLVHARNRALDEADSLEIDWFLGIDDDVEVHPDWLVRYEQAISEIDNCSVFLGATSFLYAENFSRFLPKTERSDLMLGSFPAVLSSRSMMLHKSIFSEADNGHRFDLQFNFSGGEDTDYFKLLLKHKHKICYVPEAIAFEDKSGDRAKYSTAFLRTIRNNVNFNRTLRKQLSALSLLNSSFKRIVRNSTYFFIDSVRGLILLGINPKKGMLFLGAAGVNIAVILGILGYYVGVRSTFYSGSNHTQTNA